jgi:uncharacterized protein YbjT (DUF2867 family)
MTHVRVRHRSRLAEFGALLVALPLAALAATGRDDGALILGGAGKTGAIVAKLLVARGMPVTVFVRPATPRTRLAGLAVSYAVGDAMNPNDVAAAFQGHHYSVVFETIQVAPDTPQSYTKLYQNFVPWARRTGVTQVISLGGGCGDRGPEECPLSPVLYRLTKDMTRAEHVLRDSGVPYTIIRVGALIPGNPNDPAASMATGQSFLTTDVQQFGVSLRGDLAEQVVDCIGAARCLNKIFVIDDPTLKPQLDHWLCKRRFETDTVHVVEPRCGDMPPFDRASLPRIDP